MSSTVVTTSTRVTKSPRPAAAPVHQRRKVLWSHYLTSPRRAQLLNLFTVKYLENYKVLCKGKGLLVLQIIFSLVTEWAP